MLNIHEFEENYGKFQKTKKNFKNRTFLTDNYKDGPLSNDAFKPNYI